jgi:hypothetical protein
MNRRHTATLAFAAALTVAGAPVGVQASTSGATRTVTHSQTSHGMLSAYAAAASSKDNPLPRPYLQNRMFALSTAEMIYMHESLVGSLVSLTPAAVPAPPVRKHLRKAPPAARK